MVDRVLKVRSCAFTAGAARWDFAHDQAEAIDAHWRESSSRNPHFFNGTIYLTRQFEVDDGCARADFVKTDFKSYLLWRDSGFPETGVRDGFGSALIVASDGGVLLGRQAEGHVNSGRIYLPGGFIDARDVGNDGLIDIRGSIEREIAEETGLDPCELVADPGYLITENGPHISFAVTYRSELRAVDLCNKVTAHIASEVNPELTEIIMVRRASDLDGRAMVPYARILLSKVFAASG